MNGMNITTKTVHEAKTVDGDLLMQVCGNKANQTAYLVETTEAVTCKRCLSARPAKVATPAAKTVSQGPTTWGVFNADNTLRTFADTKREAQAKADRIGAEGLTVRKF